VLFTDRALTASPDG